MTGRTLTSSATVRRMAGVALFVSCGTVALLPARPAARQADPPPPDSYVPVRLAVTFGGDLRATPEEVDAAVVSERFFPQRLAPVVGRFLTPADGADAAFLPAVISHGLYLSRFGGDMDAIAAPMLIAGQRLSVVGVAPASFDGGEAGWLWLPRVRLPESDPAAGAAADIDGVWDADLRRDGAVLWPADQPERPLEGTVRGRVSIATIRVPACAGCLALRGTMRVAFESMLPAGPPVNLRLLPERPAGDVSRAISGLLMPGDRVHLITMSGRCQRCGEIAFDGSILAGTVSGAWAVETAAVSRPGDRGRFTLRRALALR